MRRFFIFILLLFCSVTQNAQTSSNDLNQKIISASIHYEPQAAKRKLTVFKNRAARFNPFNYLGAAVLFVYQNVFSEQIQADCAYQTSCSEYTKLALAQYGIIRGTLEGFNQLSECAPGARYEHCPLFVNGDGKIINPLEKAAK